MQKRILIVDDDKDFNTLLTDVFEQADFKVTSVNDPLDAIKVFEKSEIDLVVTDHRMPNLSGVELVKKLQEIRKVPMIMVSGFLDNDTIRDMIKQGLGGVFLKPLNIFALLNKTRELLNKAEAEQGGGESQERVLEFKHSLPFEFESFPCKAQPAVDFARRLHNLREFKSNLLLIGPPGSNFRGVCEDLKGFSGNVKEELLYIDQESFSEMDLVRRLRELVNDNAERVTVVIPRTEGLTNAQKNAIFSLAKKEEPFSGLNANVRFVFCMRKDLETLYDESAVDESLYIFLGTSEVRIPSIKECREDVPLLGQRLLKTAAEKREMKGNHQLDTRARKFLMEQPWPANYRQLKEVVDESLNHIIGDVVTEKSLREAIEYLDNKQLGGKVRPLRQHLESVRDEFLKALVIFNEGDIDEVVRVSGAPRQLVEQAAAEHSS